MPDNSIVVPVSTKGLFISAGGDMRRVVFVIDGWFMRKRIYKLKSFFYNGENIRKYCFSHLREGDTLYRIFYYDTEPLNMKGTNPISKKTVDFRTTKVAVKQNALLDSIKRTPNFALRLGQTEWTMRDWELKSGALKALLNKTITVDQLTENDISPRIGQKAVDMKIGLDIAFMATKGVADLLIIITGDSDIVPALKFARREGMQVGLDSLHSPIKAQLSEHIDFWNTKVLAPKRQ